GIFILSAGVACVRGGKKHARGEQRSYGCSGEPREPPCGFGAGNFHWSHWVDLFPNLVTRVERGRNHFLQSCVTGRNGAAWISRLWRLRRFGNAKLPHTPLKRE